MITDEQVRLVANILLNAPLGHNQPDDWMTDTRKALEEYEASKWVSVDDSLPEKGVPVLALKLNTNGTRSVKTDYVLNGEFNAFCDITHWQPLPEFKE